MPPLLRSIITPLLALALAPTVAAQSPWLPPVVQMDPSVGATLARTDASISQVRDAARAAYRPTPTTGVSTLESFSLTFLNSDHKIRRLGVLDDDRFALFAFADQDSNDPFRGAGVWWAVPEGREGEVSGVSRGLAVVELPPGPPDHVLVLRGFEVRREDRTDANVRTFGVSLDSEARTATVVFSDDEGVDWRGFEATLGVAALLAFVPPDAGTAVAVSSADALSRLNNGSAPAQGQLPGRPYAFTVQYAWIPERFVRAARAATGYSGPLERHEGRGPAGQPPVQEAAPSPLALQGFLFAFGNGDHHLERVAVDLAAAGGHPSLPNWPPPVFFKDDNRDDPMQWAVEYVELREP